MSGTGENETIGEAFQHLDWNYYTWNDSTQFLKQSGVVFRDHFSFSNPRHRIVNELSDGNNCFSVA